MSSIVCIMACKNLYLGITKMFKFKWQLCEKIAENPKNLVLISIFFHVFSTKL